MTTVFFSGYGWWFYNHRINNRSYSITKQHGPTILFPVDSIHETPQSTPIKTVGFFYLERDDNSAYLYTKKATHITKLHPSIDGEPGTTFPQLTNGLQLGMKSILPEDCIFVIDNSQDPEFTFPDDKKNEQQETMNPAKLIGIKQNTQEENKPIKNRPKKHKLRWLIWRVYQYLLGKNESTTAQAVWDEIRHRHETHDKDSIIEEVTADTIFWDSNDSNNPTFNRKSLDSTLVKLKNNPPF